MRLACELNIKERRKGLGIEPALAELFLVHAHGAWLANLV